MVSNVEFWMIVGGVALFIGLFIICGMNEKERKRRIAREQEGINWARLAEYDELVKPKKHAPRREHERHTAEGAHPRLTQHPRGSP